MQSLSCCALPSVYGLRRSGNPRRSRYPGCRTGAVHTAPGHGPDDYVIGQNMVWKPLTRLARTVLICRALPDAGWRERLQGERYCRCAATEKGALLHVEKMQHSYPCCWLTKRRSSSARHRSGSSAWIRRSACAVTERDQRRAVDPGLGQARIESMVANRPDWCISRQPPGAYRCHCSCTKTRKSCIRYPRTDGRSG